MGVAKAQDSFQTDRADSVMPMKEFMRAKFDFSKEVFKTYGDRRLCLQYGIWTFSNGRKQRGYRFTWRKPNGHMLTRGQARIPSIAVALELMRRAKLEGWGNRRSS